MMRPLGVWIAILISLVNLAACADDTRTDSADTRVRDSLLARDLEIAGATGASPAIADGRDSSAVTDSPGMLDSTRASSDTGSESGSARTASDTGAQPAGSTPSAEGYIGPSCASPARDDQQRCLLGYLARSDAQLDRSYQALITRLKREAGTGAKESEPPSVQRLRTAQRQWLVYRDDECRRRTKPREGPLWAPIRAQCLAEYSALRARELDDALAKRKSIATTSESTKAKSTNGTKSKRARRRSSR